MKNRQLGFPPGSDKSGRLILLNRKCSRLPQTLSDNHYRRQRNINRTRVPVHRNQQPRIGFLMHFFGHARRFPSHQDNIVFPKFKFGIRPAGMSRQQNDSPIFLRMFFPILLKVCPGIMPAAGHHFQIIHSGAAHRLLVKNETAGFDNVQRHIQTGTQTQQRAGVLRNIGLKQSQTHLNSSSVVLLSDTPKPLMMQAFKMPKGHL